jgi:hypothetical protein
MFFIPVVTQIAALVVGIVAVARQRKPKERVTLAWVGIAIAVVALGGWFVIISGLVIPAVRMTVVGVPPAYVLDSEEDWSATGTLADAMKRIHQAASAYRRDYGSWPDEVELLIGKSLPLSFSVPKELTYRAVPAQEQRSYSRILLVSEPVRYDLGGQLLDEPHQLVCRLGGKVELLPVAGLTVEPAEQRPEPVYAEPEKPRTGP